eukprot:488817-Pyramimonas_sp.AAC.1
MSGAQAGTACEFLFKEQYSTSIHLQNTQLYIWGIFSNLFVLIVQERDAFANGTLWDGIDLKVMNNISVSIRYVIWKLRFARVTSALGSLR